MKADTFTGCRKQDVDLSWDRYSANCKGRWETSLSVDIALLRASLVAQKVKICLQCRPELNPWVSQIPWRKEWLPTPVFLPGEFHGQTSLAGYSPQGLKESDMTERLTPTHSTFQMLCHVQYYIMCSNFKLILIFDRTIPVYDFFSSQRLFLYRLN